MKRDFSAIIIGVLFLAAGIAVGGSMLGYFDFTVNFAGWWTLFIIIPALIAIIQGNVNAGSLIMLAVGLILLLKAQGLMPYNFSWRLIFPLALLIIGFQVLFGGTGTARLTGFRHAKKQRDEAGTETKQDAGGIFTSASHPEDSHKTASVLFGGQEIFYGSETVSGASYSAIFGGLTINMRNVTITGDIIIQVSATFAGIEIILPENVQLVTNIVPILGGVECKYAPTNNTVSPKVIVNGTVALGGIEIK